MLHDQEKNTNPCQHLGQQSRSGPGKLEHETGHQVDRNVLKVCTVEFEGRGQQYWMQNIWDTAAPWLPLWAQRSKALLGFVICFSVSSASSSESDSLSLLLSCTSHVTHSIILLSPPRKSNVWSTTSSSSNMSAVPWTHFLFATCELAPQAQLPMWQVEEGVGIEYVLLVRLPG